MTNIRLSFFFFVLPGTDQDQRRTGERARASSGREHSEKGKKRPKRLLIMSNDLLISSQANETIPDC
jgi:hypothetical protein